MELFDKIQHEVWLEFADIWLSINEFWHEDQLKFSSIRIFERKFGQEGELDESDIWFFYWRILTWRKARIFWHLTFYCRVLTWRLKILLMNLGTIKINSIYELSTFHSWWRITRICWNLNLIHEFLLSNFDMKTSPNFLTSVFWLELADIWFFIDEFSHWDQHEFADIKTFYSRNTSGPAQIFWHLTFLSDQFPIFTSRPARIFWHLIFNDKFWHEIQLEFADICF